MSIIRFIKRLRIQFLQRISILKDIASFLHLLSKYNASIRTDLDREKMQYTLLRENHVVEKGMSMRNPKKGFGQLKIKDLIVRLNKYIDLYGDCNMFLNYPLNTISKYIIYTKNIGIEIPQIEEAFQKLCNRVDAKDLDGEAGIQVVEKTDIQKDAKEDFAQLLMSRHSIRYFTGEIPNKALIEDALRLASQTPSACNRQGWRTHIFLGEKSVDIAKWQEGARGFENEIVCSILITANLKAFLYHEIHQAYIDGGLYAMNLINALHYVGLGTIALSCGFSHKKLKKLSAFNIPKEEVPIVLVGCGELLDRFKIAVSERKNINFTNTFHN